MIEDRVLKPVEGEGGALDDDAVTVEPAEPIEVVAAGDGLDLEPTSVGTTDVLPLLIDVLDVSDPAGLTAELDKEQLYGYQWWPII